MLSSVWQSVLKLFIEFFSSILYFSALGFLSLCVCVCFWFWLFLVISVSWLNFYFCSCIVFQILINCLSVCLCRLLNIFKRIILNTLCDSSQISIYVRTVIIAVSLVLVSGAIFPFFMIFDSLHPYLHI